METSVLILLIVTIIFFILTVIFWILYGRDTVKKAYLYWALGFTIATIVLLVVFLILFAGASKKHEVPAVVPDLTHSQIVSDGTKLLATEAAASAAV